MAIKKFITKEIIFALIASVIIGYFAESLLKGIIGALTLRILIVLLEFTVFKKLIK